MDQQREIEQIAYELYLKRGGRSGDSAADWFMAERIYIERMQQSAPMTTTETVESQKPVAKTTTRKKADAAKTSVLKPEKTVKSTNARTRKSTKKAE